MSVVVAEPQQALSVLEFIQERGFAIDKLYVDRFWSSISDDQWIYICNETLRWMGYNQSEERKMKHQYVLLLSSHFRENEDYKQLHVSELHGFIVLPGQDNNLGTHGNSRYLLVSPDTFKESLMRLNTRKANEIRKYYLSVEKVFKAYVKYQQEFAELALRAQEQETSRLQQRVDEMEALQADLASMAINTTPLVYKEYVYILTSRRYFGLNLFKVGETGNLRHRLVGYNTGNALSSDEYFYLCSIPTSNSRGLEKQLHTTLESYRFNREWFRIHPCDLLTLIRLVSIQQKATLDTVNHLIANQSDPKMSIDIDQFVELVNAKTHVNMLPDTSYKRDLKRKQSNVAVRLLLHFYEGMKDDKSVKYKKDTLYSIYNGWAEREGEKVVPCTSLVAMLKDLGFCQSSQKEKQSDGSRKSARMFRLDRAMIKSHLGEFIEYDEDCDGCD
jgi:phage anti-repressor protein